MQLHTVLLSIVVIANVANALLKPNPYPVQASPPTHPMTGVAFHQCVPFQKNQNPVNYAMFSKPVICNSYVDEACQQLQRPVPLLFLPRTPAQNLAYLGGVITGSYACREATLQSITGYLNDLKLQPKAPVP
ncbi:unnamed protein product [Absidia cylindrospora]